MLRLKVRVFSGPIYRPKVGSSVCLLRFLVGEPDYYKHRAVCFAISGPQTVCLAPFISLTTAAGECAFAFLLVVLINCDFNVKEGLMKYSRKSCDALQRKRIQN